MWWLMWATQADSAEYKTTNYAPLCYLVPIMLPPTNYAQNYASIIGKALMTGRLLFDLVDNLQF